MRTFRVGLVGFGTVGACTFQHLTNPGFGGRDDLRVEVVKCLVKSDKPRAADPGLFTTDPEAFLRVEYDLVVELAGGLGDIEQVVRQTLSLGTPVVSANKELIAKRFEDLHAAAAHGGTTLQYEAAVAGGIPIVRVIGEDLSGNRVNRIRGILNGTTNYILSRMELEGLSFDEVLRDAQALGYAEADPSSDVDGFDAAYKITILAKVAGMKGVSLDSARIESIRQLSLDDIGRAKAEGKRYKVVAQAEPCGNISVDLRMLSYDDPLSQVMGSTNAVEVNASLMGDLFVSGPGAGAEPTTSSVLADVLRIVRVF